MEQKEPFSDHFCFFSVYWNNYHHLLNGNLAPLLTLKKQAPILKWFPQFCFHTFVIQLEILFNKHHIPLLSHWQDFQDLVHNFDITEFLSVISGDSIVYCCIATIPKLVAINDNSHLFFSELCWVLAKAQQRYLASCSTWHHLRWF